jgi:hypothetical protein
MAFFIEIKEIIQKFMEAQKALHSQISRKRAKLGVSCLLQNILQS